jgi:Calx-beta domain
VKRSAGLAVAATVGLALLPLAEVPASAACADVYPAMALGPFPPEAQTTTQLFYASDGQASGSFNVQWTGFSCGRHLPVNAEYSDVPGSATEPADYGVPSGQRTPDVCDVGCALTQATISFPITIDGLAEPVTELFTITLSNPQGGSIDTPSSAPFVLVDADGSPRVAFDDLKYEQSESYETLSVAVWRAGSVSTPTTVTYTVGPGSSNPATVNEDYRVVSPNPLVFNPGDRVELITLSIVNDKLGEGDETVLLELQGAVPPTTKTVTILDNEESVRPTSRLHHPRHGWRYRKSDFRIREVHVFANDEGGAGVVGAQLGLRRNMKGGECQWLTNKGWQKRECSNREWLHMHYETSGDLWLHRVRQLKSSVGTRIKSYTAFSRAIDGAGNVEKEFKEKRNANTFEVKRAKKKRG